MLWYEEGDAADKTVSPQKPKRANLHMIHILYLLSDDLQ